MNSTYRPVVGLLCVLGGIAAVVGASRLLAAKEIIPWRDDFGAAQMEARRDDKPIFAYFTADWCQYCQEMKTTTWASTSVEAALRAYVPVRIDVDRHPDLAERYHVNSLPAFFVLNADGQALRPAAAGEMDVASMLDWLHKKSAP